MPRRKVLEILRDNGFSITREGGRHTELEKQDEKGKWWTTFVPRHSEVSMGVTQDIIKQSGKEREEFW